MSDFGLLSPFLGKLAGKVFNGVNSSQELMCLGKCDKIIKHISISYADALLSDCSGQANDIAASILGTAWDLIPAGIPLMLGNSYACVCCNKIRWHGGTLSSQANKRDKSVYLKKK
jgi:hypothetical protein